MVKSYGERRDCLDQQWASFVLQLGYMPIPLPNIAADQATELMSVLQLEAIILTGGNSLASLNPAAADAAPERDQFEMAVISTALALDIPLIGVCRGMQLLNIYMGGSLTKVTGHVGQPHPIVTNTEEYDLPKRVNSFHQYSIPSDGLSNMFNPLAFDEDGNIEAFYALKKNILAIMWHPEREEPFSNLDMQLFKRFLL